jgi:hypothetical protein
MRKPSDNPSRPAHFDSLRASNSVSRRRWAIATSRARPPRARAH